MMRTWILAVIAAFGVMIGGYNVTRADDANCPTCTQVAQNGDALQIFLAMMQGAPPGAFTYKDAKSLGPNAFELTGIVIMPDGPGSEVPIQHLLVENIDLMSLMQGGMPKGVKMKVEGIGLSRNNMDLDSDVWEALGQDEVVANISLDMLSDPTTKAFTLNDLTIDLLGIGQAQLKLDLLGVGPEAMMAPEAAMFSGAVKSASIMLNDQSLVARSLDAAIKESGMTEAELMGQGLQELSNNLAEMGAMPGDRIFQVGAAFGGWLQDARAPKGPITLSVAPAQPVNFQQISQAAGASEAAELLNLQVSYAGSIATLPEPVAGQPSDSESYVFTDKDIYAPGEVVTVYWSATPGNPQDVVSVVAEGAPASNLGNWTYTSGVTDGSYEVAGLANGYYEVRVFYDYPNGGDTIHASYYFTVGDGSTTPDQVMGNATVGTDKPSYKAGDTVLVFWAGLPGNPQDWVTVVPAGSSPDEWGQWTYTNGQATGAYQVSGLAAGDYEVRVYYDYPNGGNTIHAVAGFSVTP